MKKIGFLSFGHWTAVAGVAGDHCLGRTAPVRRARGGSGGGRRRRRVLPRAPLRARSSGRRSRCSRRSGARTSRIEIGTAVIDMRYENPLYMVEDAGAADLLAGGRLQLGISRGSPEQVIDGWRYFGYQPAEGQTDADMARRHTQVFLDLLQRRGVRPAEPAADVPQPARAVATSSRTHRACATGSGGAPRRRTTASWAAGLGMNLMSSTLVFDDASGDPFHVVAGPAHRGLPRGVEGGGARARAARLGQPQHLRARERPRPPRTSAPARGEGDHVGYIDATNARDLRPHVRRRARRARRPARRGRGDRRRGHAAADRAEPARRRVQRARRRERREVRRARARVALIRTCPTRARREPPRGGPLRSSGEQRRQLQPVFVPQSRHV